MIIAVRIGSVRSSALVVCVLAACMFPSAAVAAPSIDGRIDPTEGYSDSYNVTFTLEGGSQVSGGRLLIYVDDASGDVSVAFEQPTSLVDNSYGVNSVGWGDSKKGTHKFKELLGSDKALHLFADDQGGQIVDVMLDFLYETAKDSGVYDSGIEPGKDSYVNPDTLEPMITAASSLDYNLNTLGYIDIDQDNGDDLTEDSPETLGADSYELVPGSPYPEWIFEVIYEMKLDGEIFEDVGGFDVSMLDISVVHDSPNKLGDKTVTTEIDSPPPTSTGVVPEPVTMLAVIAGIGSLGGYLRKRRCATAW